MKKYYHGDMWKLGEDEFFATKEALLEYVKDNWEEYAYPIADEKVLLDVVDSPNGGIEILFKTMDRDPETGDGGLWVQESSNCEVEIIEITSLL